MKRLFSSIILGTLFASTAGAYTFDGTNWINNGDVFTAPTIDATNVINYGTFNIATSRPFETSNTQNFTNANAMTGRVGWLFDTAARNSSGQLIGQRQLARNFHNRSESTVTAVDGNLPSGFSGSYVLVHATNVVNQGNLNVGAAGQLQIAGTNVNLVLSGLQVNAIVGRGSFVDDTNYIPDVAIYDNWWGQSNDLGFATSEIITYVGSTLVAQTPSHRVTAGGAYGSIQFSVFDPYTAAFTNLVSSTNYSITNSVGDVEDNVEFPTSITRQAAFVAISNPTNFSVAIGFRDSSIFTNKMKTVVVELAVAETNVVAQQNQFNTIYFVDTLAAETNRGLLYNTSYGTSIPANYRLSRTFPPGGAILDGNTEVTNTFFYDEDEFLADFVTDASYAGYSAYVDNLTSLVPVVPGGTVTNQPGRLEISAKNLNLNGTRMRAGGYLSLEAQHLISSANAVLDCQNLNFNLGSTNGLLKIQNLAKETVARLRGDLYAWSGLWTNSIEQVIENYAPDPDDTNSYIPSPITNIVEVNLHALILDATSLLDILPVTIWDLKAKATNVSMSDSGVVSQNLLIDGLSFTLSGRLTLTGTTPNWNVLNAPILRYFTNTGTLNIENEAHFGDDGAQSYLAFVNRGIIQSQGQTIKSDYAELGGDNLVGAGFNLVTLNGKIEAGSIDAANDISLSAESLKFNQARITSQKSLYLSVTNALFDNGTASSNILSCRDGFALTRKPATGDLLGTDFRTVAPKNVMVNHLWAGRDDGVSKAGYVNNVALGKLTLLPESANSYFGFAGPDANNGLYVDVLDLSQLADYASQLQIEPSLTIYYAAAKLSFTPPGGQSAEEYLDGQLDGRLRWVSEYSGPNSSVAVVINGNQTIQVNKALYESKNIDSDADGVPNFYDVTPFGGVQIDSIARNPSPVGFLLSWDGAANTIYRVEYRTNLTSGVWVPLLTVTNATSVTAPLSALDTNGVAGAAQRYYRVIYSPNSP